MNTTHKTSSIEAILKDYITETFLYDQAGFILTNDLPLFEQRVIDSMGILRLISFITEKFNVTVQLDEIILENFSTIGNIAALVDTHLQRAQAAQY